MKWMWGLTLFLVSCSSIPTVKLGTSVEKPKEPFNVVLETKAQIFAIEKMPKPVCEQSKNPRLTIRNWSTDKEITLKQSCEMVPGALVTYSTVLPSAKYQVRMRSLAKTLITANCENPESKSDKNELTLEPENTVDGYLNRALCKSTQWIAVQKGIPSASMTLVSDSSDFEAELYVLDKASKTPRKIGALAVGRKKTIPATSGKILLKVTAKKYSGEIHYALNHLNTPPSKIISVPVVDCYPVSEAQSIVLLTPTEALKVNDQLDVFGYQKSGGSVSLGTCVVNSVSESQASCRLPKVVQRDFTRFSAQLVTEG